MRRVLAIAVIAEAVLVAIVLHSEIIYFIHAHPWWHTALAAILEILAPILAILELRHSGEANKLRMEANDQRDRANALQEEQNESIAEIAALQRKNAELARELDTERNAHLQQIAANTKRALTEAEINARTLKKYLGQRVAVSEGHGYWGGGAVIAEVSDNNILTLFVPTSHYNSQAYAQLVRCDKLHIVEAPKDGCPVQISILERYGAHTPYGEARSWEERNVQPAHAGMKRGANAFHAQYRKPGVAEMRNIYIYASTDGSPNYTMVTTEGQQETSSSHSGKAGIERKFAIVQLEWIDQGYHWVSGSNNDGSLNLFVRK